jgi:hypothetical protein
MSLIASPAVRVASCHAAMLVGKLLAIIIDVHAGVVGVEEIPWHGNKMGKNVKNKENGGGPKTPFNQAITSILTFSVGRRALDHGSPRVKLTCPAMFYARFVLVACPPAVSHLYSFRCLD